MGKAGIVDWNDKYSLGLAEIDEQHKMLFDLINKLWVLTIKPGSAKEMEQVLNALEQYTIAHFTAEETLMRMVDYPDFEQHKGSHKAFVNKVAEEKRKLAEKGTIGLEILHFLRDWLVNHILSEDKTYAAYYIQQQKPKSLLGRLFASFR